MHPKRLATCNKKRMWTVDSSVSTQRACLLDLRKGNIKGLRNPHRLQGCYLLCDSGDNFSAVLCNMWEYSFFSLS